MNAHEIYRNAMQRINDAQTPGESSDAASDGMNDLAAIYDATNNENTKAQCRRLIGKLDTIDHEGDIEASERRACGILEG